MALDTYSGLSTAIDTWTERSFSTDQKNEFILLTEARANRKLRQDFRRRSSATINTDSSGAGTLPTGFVGMTSLVRDVVGSVPLKQVSWDALISRNPYEISDDASVFAINGTSIQVAPVTDDNFLAKFSAVLSGLSSGNTTNWLLALAPDFYLFGCKAAVYAFEEDEARAASYLGLADDILDELVSQGNVAEYGNAEMTLGMVTP